MRNFFKDHKAFTGFLAAIVLVITVMMAAVIGAIVFFAFSDSSDIQLTDSYTDAITGSVDIWVPLSITPGDDPEYSVTVTNATATREISAGATGYEYVSGNNTIRVDAVALEAADTQIDIDYYGRSHDTVNDVVAYAITIFALIAIVPLIMVGGLMLRSLGFMGGGKEF